ncbi:DUF305 domain-containing protein [Microbacterium thalassium]|uniref:Uncharacterized protein (DUF305 family) n=1 Tax=Microbacterium thalassium TaxID=362649 RepID=A0A7X0KW28_9MICO|nr:DUF305 domain-containing protein [Microbacterium thalassium]MBB6392850.1 uncharacterized protein (DUF305 family) [Microbacterium thalassium]GLK22919.1 hypothetical protein GCM10017607_02370 [Microbacterium thalassium]
MRRKAPVVVALVVAVAVAGAGIAIALSAVGDPAPSPEPTAGAAEQDFGETEYCYVEAMIYYRAEAVDLADILLNAEGVSVEATAIAQDVYDQQSEQLAELREVYLEWKSARPLERTEVGPCAGHDDHSAMVGLPGWSDLRRYSESSGTEAEQGFAELMIAQNAGVTAFAELVLEYDPNAWVTDAASDAIAQAESEDAVLATLLP